MNGWFLVLTSCNVLAAVTTGWFSRRLHRDLHGSSVRSLTELALELSELGSAFGSLKESHQKLVKRISMREIRAREREGDGSSETQESGAGVPDTREATLRNLRERARTQGLL